MKTLIIIPARNEAQNLPETLRDLRENGPEADVLVINDCSEDGTEALLEREKVNHVRLAIHAGIGGAVQTGYRYALEAGYDIAVQFDGDGQHEAAWLHALLAPLLAGEADAVIGSRFLEKEGFQSSGARRLGIRWLSGLIRLLGGVRVMDVTSGMRAVNRRLTALYAERYSMEYPEPEALLLAALKGARIREVSVRMRPRRRGHSSINALHGAYYLLKETLALVLTRLGTKKEARP